MQLYVLDELAQLVPVGVAGELYLGGTGLARGYVGRAELTAERFVPNGYGAGERIYRTGDLVRWLPGGTIEYLGRNDDQVKIRGFRIELGEIETRLAEYPGVQEVAVVVRQEQESEKRLVAYYTAEEEIGIEQMRWHLGMRLPEYMVPAAYVRLPRMPLTPSGKLDRQALPSPDLSKQMQHQYVAPITSIERIICEIWQSVLQVERVGIHDNFFDLGGHSLAMVRVREQIRKKLDREFPLMAMFEHSTIASCAKYLVKNHSQNSTVPLFPEPDQHAAAQQQRVKRQREQRNRRLSLE